MSNKDLDERRAYHREWQREKRANESAEAREKRLKSKRESEARRRSDPEKYAEIKRRSRERMKDPERGRKLSDKEEEEMDNYTAGAQCYGSGGMAPLLLRIEPNFEERNYIPGQVSSRKFSDPLA